MSKRIIDAQLQWQRAPQAVPQISGTLPPEERKMRCLATLQSTSLSCSYQGLNPTVNLGQGVTTLTVRVWPGHSPQRGKDRQAIVHIEPFSPLMSLGHPRCRAVRSTKLCSVWLMILLLLELSSGPCVFGAAPHLVIVDVVG